MLLLRTAKWKGLQTSIYIYKNKQSELGLPHASFLIGIRGARYIEENIEFTAGSEFVSGSVFEKELEEIN